MNQNAQSRGTKRKRYEPPKEDPDVKLGGKLHHDLKEIRKTAKKAKVFELQKQVKKLKSVRQKEGSSEEVQEAEAQLECLKTINHEPIAHFVFRSRLLKDRILADNPVAQSFIEKELTATSFTPSSPGTPASKVESRLLSSKILATELHSIIADLRRVLQPESESHEQIERTLPDESNGLPERPQKKGKKAQKDAAVEDGTTSSRTPRTLSDVNEGIDTSDSEAARDFYDEEEGDDFGWESGTVDEDGGPSGAHTDGSESALSSGSARQEAANSLDVPKLKSSTASRTAGIAKPDPPKASAKATGVQSTFLPSLAVGYIRGGSDDSDWSEDEAKIADINPKKNRRGQRARQAIWEKKFGRNANHKKKEAEAEAAKPQRATRTRGEASAQKRKPSKTPTHVHGKQHHQTPDSGWGQQRVISNSKASIKVSGGSHSEGGALHPSWEAKRKLKEKEGAGIVASQGKKIKFS